MESQPATQMEKLPYTNGSDLLIFLDGTDQVPVSMEMLEKWTAKDVEKQFGRNTVVYLWNKNLQNLPHRIRGGIIWLPGMKMIAAVIQAQGCCALVSVLFPLSRRGNEVEIKNLRIDGCYLQQVQGIEVMMFDPTLRVLMWCVWNQGK
jgi:hypothetical protein